jgi:uncharacterized protein
MTKSPLDLIPEEQPWYKEGLRFECTGCGQCCTGAPGYIWVSENEIKQMAMHLKLSLDEFSDRYLRQIGDRYSLRETFPNYDCIFLKDNKCSIYQLRPKQCRTFPWWPQNLKSKKDWEEAAKHCEGIRHEAPIVPFDKIENQLNMQIYKED